MSRANKPNKKSTNAILINDKKYDPATRLLLELFSDIFIANETAKIGEIFHSYFAISGFSLFLWVDFS
jgi:hypothetical protein